MGTGGSRATPPSWLSAAAKRVDFEGNVDKPSMSMMKEERENSEPHKVKTLSDVNLSLFERSLSASGAAVISAIIVNPLDVAKTRLQAQAYGVSYQNQCSPTCFEANTMVPDLKSGGSRNGIVLGGGSTCTRECSQYKGTFDVFYKVIRQGAFDWQGLGALLS